MAVDPVIAIVQALGALSGAAAEDFWPVLDVGLRRIGQALGAEVRLRMAPGQGWAKTAGVSFEPKLVLRGAASPGGEAAELGLSLASVPDTLRPALEAFLAAVDATAARMAADEAAIAAANARAERRDTLLRRLFDLSPVGILLIEEESEHVIEANSAFLGFGSWAREDLVGLGISELLDQTNHHVREEAVAALAVGDRFGPIETNFMRPDGSTFPAIVRGLALESGTGQKIVWAMVEDVSDVRRHLAEAQAARDEALRAKDELNTAVQALPHGFVLFDDQDRVVLVNDQMQQVFPEFAPYFEVGLPYWQVLRNGVGSGLFPAADGREDAFIAAIMAGRDLPEFECLTTLREGRIIRVLERAIPNGGRVGLRLDVTDQYETARRLSDVIDGAQAGTWEVDLTTGMNIVNDHWAEMLGWKRSDFDEITTETWRSLIHEADFPAVVEKVERLVRGEISQYDHTYRMAGADGAWVWINDRGRVSARGPDGMPTRMAGVHVDVTALKLAEERLEQIIEGAQVGTWQYEAKTGLNRINSRWANMLGYELEELEPMDRDRWREIAHPDDFDLLLSQQEAMFERKEWVFESELRLRHKAGHWVWILSRGRVTQWDTDGLPLIMSGVHIDISASKELESQLENERDFLATLTETSVSGIMAVDSDARIVFFNREVQQIFELPNEALMGQLCDPQSIGISGPEGQPMTLKDMPCRRAQLAGKTVRDMRLRVSMADGRTKVVSVNAAPVSDPQMTAQVVCTVTDITATAEAEDRLRAAMDRAEAANRAKSQFLANMSHELRTPLNGVLGMAELLVERAHDDAQRDMANAILESGGLLLSILNDVLDLAKIESGKLSLEAAPFGFGDVLARIETMHQLTAWAKGLRLNLSLGEGTDRMRMGDAQRLMQVLHNLVGNAVKFTESGHVDVRISARDEVVTIEVQDTGIGMTDAQAAQVFDEFTQGDGSITRRFGGTGLGLPIVRRLVDLMGGDIILTSTPGQGTTMTVTLTLPLAPEGPAAEGPSPRPSFDNLRALVAEDNATNRVIIRAMLGRLGIRATMVQDGDEAVQAWSEGAFDLLFLDISMPRKDGVTALGELRAKAGDRPFPPVIAVTANAMTHLVADYLAAGFDAVVAKPLQLDALAGTVAEVMAPRGSGISRAAR